MKNDLIIMCIPSESKHNYEYTVNNLHCSRLRRRVVAVAQLLFSPPKLDATPTKLCKALLHISTVIISSTLSWYHLYDQRHIISSRPEFDVVEKKVPPCKINIIIMSHSIFKLYNYIDIVNS